MDVGGILKGLLPTLLRTVGGVTGLGAPADQLAKLIEGKPDIPLTPEQAAAVQAVLAQHEKDVMDHALELAKLDAADVAVAGDVDKAMLASGDKYTQRARPTSLYAAVLLSGLEILVVCVAILREIRVDWTVITALTGMVTPLWGHGILYSQGRTREKVAAMGNGS